MAGGLHNTVWLNTPLGTVNITKQLQDGYLFKYLLQVSSHFATGIVFNAEQAIWQMYAVMQAGYRIYKIPRCFKQPVIAGLAYPGLLGI